MKRLQAQRMWVGATLLGILQLQWVIKSTMPKLHALAEKKYQAEIHRVRKGQASSLEHIYKECAEILTTLEGITIARPHFCEKASIYFIVNYQTNSVMLVLTFSKNFWKLIHLLRKEQDRLWSNHLYQKWENWKMQWTKRWVSNAT